jgi:lysophospholipase L1-like esterase
MVSMASVNDLTADRKKNVENVMINAGADCDASKKGKWLPLGPGFGSQAVNFGLELFLGKTLSDSMPGVKIAFIKNSVCGTVLGQSDAWLPPSSNKGTGGTLYKNMMTHIDAAMKSFGSAFDTANYIPRWAGFIWLQGESDAMNQNLANAYEANLDNLIKDIRAKVGAADLPVVLPLITTLPKWTYNVKIRDADVAMKLKLKNVDTLETKEYQTPDGMHYNAAGQMQIGTIAALRWLAMKYADGIAVPVVHDHAAPPALFREQRWTASRPVLLFDMTGRLVPTGGAASGVRISALASVSPALSHSHGQLHRGKTAIIR